ncbi:MAG: hypothetical protein IJP96_04715 [Synergistaceae bacterium]|nr:hypothetical protein [Bacilli bacterium]MBR0075032.1 hypothetical protein [Synergistaceae bacterium]
MPNNFLTLNDLRATLMPDGSPVKSYAELLAKENEILDDFPMTQGNQLTGDIHFKRTAMPSAQIRRINQGFDSSKGGKEAVTDTCVEIVSRMTVDMRELDLAPSPENYLLSESKPHIEAINEDVVTSLFYGTDPEGIKGFATRLSKLSHKQVVDAGGTGNNLASIYIIKWDNDEVTGIYPKNTKAGLEIYTKENEYVLDKDGKPFRAHITEWSWFVGLKVRDERYLARLCNIDRDALLTGSTAQAARQELFNKMIIAKNKIHHVNEGRVVMYADPEIFSILEIAAFEKSNLALGYADVESDRRVLRFAGIPIKRNDAQTIAEKKVA